MISAQTVKTALLSVTLVISSIVRAEPQQNDEQRYLESLIEFELFNKNWGAKDSDALHIRENAIREAAVTVGIQGGIKYRYSQINHEINKLANYLDSIYDFKPLLIKEKMMPPIIAEANGAFSLQVDGSATSSMTTFEIIRDAKLVATAPQWRDYLIHDYQAKTDVNPVLKPKNDDETAAWQDGVKSGWAEGIEIADRMALEHINRLIRDYRGSIRFHQLAQQGIVTMPTLAIGDYGIHVNGKKLDVNQRIFRITQPSDYKKDARDWKIMPGEKNYLSPASYAHP